MPILSGLRLAALDVETTGWRAKGGDTIVEVGLVVVDDARIADEWSSLVGPRRAIPEEATRVHGITEPMLDGAPPIADVVRIARRVCGDLPMVFHNASFDLPFLQAAARAAGVPGFYGPVIDTLGLARGLFGSGGNTLGELMAKLGLEAETAHRALPDARTTARMLVALAPPWERDRGIRTVAQLAAASQDAIREAARRAAALRRAQAAMAAAGAAGPIPG